MLARIRLVLALIFAAPLVSGCLAVAAVDAAASVGGAAIDVTGATIGVAGDVAEGAVKIVIPGDGDDDEDDDGEREDER